MKKRTKNTLRMALKIWGRVVAATIMSGILYISMYIIFTALFSEPIGYRIYGSDGQGNMIQVGEYFFTPEDDPEAEPKLEEGQTSDLIKDMTPGGEKGMNIVTSILMLSVLASFPYEHLWQLGSRDDNMVKMGKRRAEPLRGVLIGFLANIPAFILYVGLILARLGAMIPGYMTIYRLFNLPFLPYINAVTNAKSLVPVTELSWLSFLGVAATLLFVPAVCGIAYWIGCNQFSFKELVTYQKKKSEIDEEI